MIAVPGKREISVFINENGNIAVMQAEDPAGFGDLVEIHPSDARKVAKAIIEVVKEARRDGGVT
jgi:hypothetical protein